MDGAIAADFGRHAKGDNHLHLPSHAHTGARRFRRGTLGDMLRDVGLMRGKGRLDASDLSRHDVYGSIDHRRPSADRLRSAWQAQYLGEGVSVSSSATHEDWRLP